MYAAARRSGHATSAGLRRSDRCVRFGETRRLSTDSLAVVLVAVGRGRERDLGVSMQLGFFGDDPVDGSTIPDRLNRSSYADRLMTLLERVREQSASSVMALAGSSGAGKSSVLQITMHLLKMSDWRVAEFNPWAYSDPTSVLLGLFAELSAALHLIRP